MKFSDYLNSYIDLLECSAKELAEACELSPAVISRYRTGEREPAPDSEQIEKLIRGLTKLAQEKTNPELTMQRIRKEFGSALNQKQADYDSFFLNFDCLSTALNINMKSLAQVLNFDVSYLYRVRSGARHPSDLESFCNSISQYIVSYHNDPDDKKAFAALSGSPLEKLQNGSDYLTCVQHWLLNNPSSTYHNDMESFLRNLDSFNLDEYIRAIHFDELKVPSVPFQLYSPRSYYGIEQMRKGELDFFKHTVLSKSMEPIFMCSDMPMSDMAEDMDFNRKWMFAIAMSLKKGLHLNIIHNIDRPFHEMMLGLESWIPIYMTGQVSPYHLPDVSTHVYHHFNYVSGTVALVGECINGHHDHGKYYLTNNREEVAYYKQKATDLLLKAQPLMDIYRSESESLFEAYKQAEMKEQSDRRNLLSSPPIYTISPELLSNILKRSGLTEEERNKLLQHAANQRILVEKTLERVSICDEFNTISPEEFQKHPVQLSFADAFCEADLTYTYEEYLAHIRQTKDFSMGHPNYFVNATATQTFRNVQIHIIAGKCVRLSKNKAPVIHFVIRHPKMVNALEHFIAPVQE